LIEKLKWIIEEEEEEEEYQEEDKEEMTIELIFLTDHKVTKLVSFM
jgi:hypothetical protein